MHAHVGQRACRPRAARPCRRGSGRRPRPSPSASRTRGSCSGERVAATSTRSVRVAAEVRLPVDGLGERVDVALVAVAAAADAPQDAAREARLEVRAAGELERSREGDAAVGTGRCRRAECARARRRARASSPRGQGAKKRSVMRGIRRRRHRLLEQPAPREHQRDVVRGARVGQQHGDVQQDRVRARARASAAARGRSRA